MKIVHVFQIALAVYHCHSFNVAHRDLKPENLLLLDKSEVSLMNLLSKRFVSVLTFCLLCTKIKTRNGEQNGIIYIYSKIKPTLCWKVRFLRVTEPEKLYSYIKRKALSVVFPLQAKIWMVLFLFSSSEQ